MIGERTRGVSRIRLLPQVLRNELPGAARFPQTPWGRRGLVIIIVVGVVLRTAGLDWGLSRTVPASPPHHDEPHVLAAITTPWETFRSTFDEYEIVRPIYVWRVLTKPFFVLGDRFGWNSPRNNVFEYVVPRAVNSVFGIVGLLAIYLLATKLGGVRAGVFALLFLAFMPGHWYYSQLLKGDLLVATFNTLLILAAIFIAERGSRCWYVAAGAIAGLGVASKPSVAVVLPVVLLAHVIRVVARREWRRLVGSDALLALLLAVGTFLLFSPYPFLDLDRLWTLHREPRTQFFRVNFQPTPASFLESWRNYNQPLRPFMEMVFGEALRIAFPIAAALFALATLLALRVKRGIPYLLTALAAFLVTHSLSFTEPLDDRYVVPLAPFVALFPALVASAGMPFLRVPRPITLLASGAGLVLVVYTAGVTWALFPTFALGKDIRVAVADDLMARVKPGETIGEFEPTGRQSLPFDRSRVALVPLRTPGSDSHVYLFGTPTYVVFQVEPWNYDHAFRYQLESPEARREFFEIFLPTFYDHLATVGREPTAFGRRLPRMLSTPVFAVYRRKEAIPAAAENLLRELTSWTSGEPRFVVLDRLWTKEEFAGKLLTATFDISPLTRAWESGGEGGGILGLLLTSDDAPPGSPIPERVPEPEVFSDEHRIGHVVPLRKEALGNANTLSVALAVREGGEVDLYSGTDGQLAGRGTVSVHALRKVRVAIAFTPTEHFPNEVRLTSVTLETPHMMRNVTP